MARTEDRDWVVMLDDFDTEEDFRQAVVEELAGLENIGLPHRRGVRRDADPRAADRVERPGVDRAAREEHVVVGWHFKQVVHARRARGRAEPPEPERRRRARGARAATS
jgi:hypothetical protein